VGFLKTRNIGTNDTGWMWSAGPHHARHTGTKVTMTLLHFDKIIGPNPT
jgi:hypothetical protein